MHPTSQSGLVEYEDVHAASLDWLGSHRLNTLYIAIAYWLIRPVRGQSFGKQVKMT